MKRAEGELEAAFADAVEAERLRRGSLATLRDAILATVGRASAAQEVERARKIEAEAAKRVPPAAPAE